MHHRYTSNIRSKTATFRDIYPGDISLARFRCCIILAFSVPFSNCNRWNFSPICASSAHTIFSFGGKPVFPRRNGHPVLMRCIQKFVVIPSFFRSFICRLAIGICRRITEGHFPALGSPTTVSDPPVEQRAKSGKMSTLEGDSSSSSTSAAGFPVKIVDE